MSVLLVYTSDGEPTAEPVVDQVDLVLPLRAKPNQQVRSLKYILYKKLVLA